MGIQLRRHADTSTDTATLARRRQRQAWTALALTPVGLVAAMVVGEALLAAQGYEVGAATAPPVGPAVLAAIPAIVVGVAAPTTAAWLGFRARRLGHEHGLAVAVIGLVVAVGFVAVNAVAATVGR